MNYDNESLKMHQRYKGKLEVVSKVPLKNKDDMSIAYTPGVAEPCRKIANNKSLVYEYTIKSNYIAVITDGTAVLGLGDIGPEAALPVMEGKCVLFKEFGGVDAIPICLDSKDVDEIVDVVIKLAPAFGGFNLEDISSPRCFEIERRLKESLDIPVFHDDQHGTAVVVLAALINAFQLVGKNFSDVEIVINGAGAAGISTARLLNAYGVKDIVLCDQYGAIYRGREVEMTREKVVIAQETNSSNQQGTLEEVIKGKDVFIGLSVPGVLTGNMVKLMSKDPIVLALANPVPEICPDEAKAAGAKIVGTGLSNYNNQVNNVLAFPGIFRGALDVWAKEINDEMKIAAAHAIAKMVDTKLDEDYILPKSFDRSIGPYVAAAVAEAAVKSGVARVNLTYQEEYDKALSIIAG